MNRIGIPYAPHPVVDGVIRSDLVQCPVCGECVSLKGRKDADSFDRQAYARHFEAHRGD